MNTNAMHRPDAEIAEIAQEHRRYLTCEALLLKNRVWVNGYQGSSGFWDKFLGKKVPRSSRLVLGYPEPRLVWVENGVSCKALSRSEGIETPSRAPAPA